MWLRDIAFSIDVFTFLLRRKYLSNVHCALHACYIKKILRPVISSGAFYSAILPTVNNTAAKSLTRSNSNSYSHKKIKIKEFGLSKLVPNPITRNAGLLETWNY